MKLIKLHMLEVRDLVVKVEGVFLEVGLTPNSRPQKGLIDLRYWLGEG